MLLKEEYSKEFLRDKLEEYSDAYNDTIDEIEKKAMSLYLLSGLYSNQTYSTINQFYHEYGLMNDKLNIYYAFRDALKEIYSDIKKKRIVDICAGKVPQLSRELAKMSDEQIIAVCDCTYMDDFYGRLEGWRVFLSQVDRRVEDSNLGEVHISRVGALPLIYTKK